MTEHRMTGPMQITRLDDDGKPVPGAQQIVGVGCVMHLAVDPAGGALPRPLWRPGLVLTIPISPENAKALRLLMFGPGDRARAKARLAMLRRKIGKARRRYRQHRMTLQWARRHEGGPPSRRIDSRRPAGSHRLGRYL